MATLTSWSFHNDLQEIISTFPKVHSETCGAQSDTWHSCRHAPQRQGLPDYDYEAVAVTRPSDKPPTNMIQFLLDWKVTALLSGAERSAAHCRQVARPARTPRQAAEALLRHVLLDSLGRGQEAGQNRTWARKTTTNCTFSPASSPKWDGNTEYFIPP